MDSDRVVLIQYRDVKGPRLGSGLRVGGDQVLTAAHVATGTGHRVTTLSGAASDATVLVTSEDPRVDLAVLSAPDLPAVDVLRCARVDRERTATVSDCLAVGFPAFRKAKNGDRRSLHVNGFVPTAEGFIPTRPAAAPFLSFKITDPAARDWPPISGEKLEDTPWAGMSGAVVVTKSDQILGVVRHHNPPEGIDVLAVTPLDAINTLPAQKRDAFWDALAVPNPDRLPVLPETHLLRETFGQLLHDRDYAVFAGRGDAVQAVEDFLHGPGGVLAATAPAGFGKTALMASLARTDPDRYAYHFFTHRYDPQWLDETFFLRSILQQLDPTADDLPTMGPDQLKARFHHHFSAPARPGAVTGAPAVLLDGLDEVTGWPVAAYLAVMARAGAHLIVSIRDTGQDWATQYRLPASTLTQLHLDGFDTAAITAVFTATGTHAADLIHQPGAASLIAGKAAYQDHAVRTIHGADPLYVRFLAEDANTPGFQLEDLDTLPTGLTAYLDRWWTDIKTAATGQPIRDLLAILTVAHGPLTAPDLQALVPTAFEDPDGWADDYFDTDVLPRIRRWVTGTQTTGYTLSHPRLTTYLTTKLTTHTLTTARNQLLDYCAHWADTHSTYALTHYPTHLAHTNRSAELLELYQGASYLAKSISALGVDQALVTLRIIQARLNPGTGEILARVARVVEREAHRLRPPMPIGQPGYVTRQLALQALMSNEPRLAEYAKEDLRANCPDQLLPQWTTELSSPALTRTLLGHTAALSDIAVTPDGSLAITASADGTAKVWDLATGIELQALKGHSEALSGIAITPDGKRAVTASLDGTARIWNLATGEAQHQLIGHTSAIFAVAISPDGSRAVTSGSDGTARVWDLTTGLEEKTLEHASAVHGAAISPDGTRVVTSGSDGTARVWDLTTGYEAHTLQGHTHSIAAVAITPDGTRAVTTSYDSTARVWDLSTGSCLRILIGHAKPVSAIAITPDSRRAVTGSWDDTARIWDLGTGATQHILKTHRLPVHAVVIDPDGARAITAGSDRTLQLWDLLTGTNQGVLVGHTDTVTAVVIAATGTQAVSVGSDGTARVWDLASSASPRSDPVTSAPRSTLDGPETSHTSSPPADVLAERSALTKRRDTPAAGHWGAVTAVAVAPDSRSVVTGGRDRAARVWDTTSGAELHVLNGHTADLLAVAITLDSNRVITAGRDHTARVWDLRTGALQHALTGHTDSVEAAAVTSDNTRAITASWDRSARVWDLSTGVELLSFDGHTNGVNAIAIVPGDRRAVTASSDGTARVWSIATGAEELKLAGHISGLNGVAVTPDGTRAVTVGFDHTARVWDLYTGDEKHILTGHVDPMHSVAISANGVYAATASDDGTIRVWNLANGTEQATFGGYGGSVHTLAFAPSSDRVTSGFADGTVRTWKLSSGAQCETIALSSACSAIAGSSLVVVGQQSGAVSLFARKS